MLGAAMTAESSHHHLYLIDGSGYIFRAFFALPPMTRPDGTPVNMQGRMIRTNRFKYYIFDKGKQPEMLIDMVNDPGEMVNLVGNKKHKSVLAEHRKLLQQYKQETGDNFVS